MAHLEKNSKSAFKIRNANGGENVVYTVILGSSQLICKNKANSSEIEL